MAQTHSRTKRRPRHATNGRSRHLCRQKRKRHRTLAHEQMRREQKIESTNGSTGPKWLRLRNLRKTLDVPTVIDKITFLYLRRLLIQWTISHIRHHRWAQAPPTQWLKSLSRWDIRDHCHDSCPRGSLHHVAFQSHIEVALNYVGWKLT